MDKPGSAQSGIRRIFEMSMIDSVRAAMVTAMKEHDKERKESLSMLLSALKNLAFVPCGRLCDTELIQNSLNRIFDLVL